MTRNEFNDIIRENSRKLFVIAYRILRNRQESEDVVQEVFLKMWMMKEKLDDYDDPAALAVTITKNNCIDLLRKWQRINIEPDGYDLQPVDPSPSPHEQVVRMENREIIDKIIDDLPPKWKNLIQLREIAGLSYEEIAEKNGLNINNLRVILSRARQQIKEKYISHTNERRQIEGTSG